MIAVVGEGPGDRGGGPLREGPSLAGPADDPGPLRVAVVAPNCSLHMGGEAALPYHYFRLLRARGVDVHLVGHQRNRDELERAFPEDLGRLHLVTDSPLHRAFYRIGWPLPNRVYRATFGGVLQVMVQAQQRRVLRRLVRTRGISVVHQPAPVSPTEPSMIFGVGAPVVIGPMNGGMDYPPGFRDHENRWERLCVRLGRRLRHGMSRLIPGKRRAALLLVSNRRTRELLPATPVPVVDLTENGVDLELWRPRPESGRPGLSDGPARFVYLGRLVGWKGVDLLLQAWAAARVSPGARLEIIGDGPLRRPLEALRDRLGLAASVEFVGPLPQPECGRRLRGADALILPSLIECGGSVVLEAMAAGLAVIATDWGGPADYLDESCGILLPPTSPDAFIGGLTAAIERLDSSPDLRRELGRAAIRRVAAFSWEAKIDRILEIYRQVVRADRGAAADVRRPGSALDDPRPCHRIAETRVTGPYRFGFIMEQSLGHATYHRRLADFLAEDPTVRATWLTIPPWEDDRWARMPVVGRNFTLSLSLRARDRLRSGPDLSTYDALFFHTQSTAMFGIGMAPHCPVVVSLDATPLNMDSVASGYNHRPDRPGPVGWLKRRWYRSVFGRAAALTTWNHWARESLIRDYGVAPDRVEVIPPGVDLAQWRPRPRDDGRSASPRVLFVGGDFARKGGPTLLEAYRSALAGRCELDIVTQGDVPAVGPGIRVHRGLSHDGSHLRQLFARADLFVLPTLSECMPQVITEAMACGLPVVSTRVGAIEEQVVHGRTGLLVPPGDAAALAEAVGALVDDPGRRRAFGAAGRDRAERLFDGRKNARALLDLLKRCADGAVCRSSRGPAGRGVVAASPVGMPPLGPPCYPESHP